MAAGTGKVTGPEGHGHGHTQGCVTRRGADTRGTGGAAPRAHAETRGLLRGRGHGQEQARGRRTWRLPSATHVPPPRAHACAPAPAGKAVYAETTTAHATLTGLHYYHQDWFHAAAYVTVPPLRLDTNTSAYLMSLLAR